MNSEAIRQRLEALNRELLPEATSIAVRPALVASTKSALGSQSPRPASPLRPGLVKTIPGLIRRGEVVANELGCHLRICVAVDELWCGGELLIQKRHKRLINHSSPVPSPRRGWDQTSKGDPKSPERSAVVRAQHPGRGDEVCTSFAPPSPNPSPQGGGGQSDLAHFVQAFPNRAILLDLETCGLSGSALFLVGLLRRIDDRLAVELLLARDYSEESAVLAGLWQRIDAEQVIVTFNGKTFDWPMVIDRSRRHLLFRGTRPPAPRHIDLLHHARRRWRRQLPDCKLQTLERHICGRTRGDNIPGGQIPAAYQQFVRTGVDREMNAILLHNAIDLVTMLDLAMRLAG
jgi:RNase_H superfamily